jgi:sialic acid synthase SpsE
MPTNIGKRIIGADQLPYVIAEAGVNYENDLEVARKMIRRAAAAGADAIKFQTYKAEKIAAKASPAYWAENKTQRQFFQQYDHFGQDEYSELARVCEAEGIVFLSTPFDLEAVEFLDPLMPAYKIASADMTNVPLLRAVAKKKKPVILSTGASTTSEIFRAVEELEAHGAREIILLHCVLQYPTEYGEAMLGTIPYLKGLFPGREIGYSDHTRPDPGMALLTGAALLGATILEKHFTLDKTRPGNDHYHAMDSADLKLLTNNLKILWQARNGGGERRVLAGEEPARRFARRSVVTEEAICAGSTISARQLTTKRPGTGIPAEQFDLVVGRVARSHILPDVILTWDMLS